MMLACAGMTLACGGWLLREDEVYWALKFTSISDSETLGLGAKRQWLTAS